jgi:acetyl esterase/lipase
VNRREFVFSAAGARLLRPATNEPQTFIYKNVGGCEIKADLFGGAAARPKPVVVWIHGGALISGSRRLSPSSPVLRSLLDAGFAVFSIDYRLAPETKLPEIIEDVQDAFRWLRNRGSSLQLDTERLGVCGSSAGGYLTLMTGFCVEPRPKALVSYWGYGDIVGPWYSRPDPFYLKQPVVRREEALAAVGSTPVSEPPAGNKRSRFYLYCRQQGIWPEEVAGRDPDKDAQWFSRYCPIRNVTRKYPPTMLVHGTADTDVPYEQSKLMAERLRDVGVTHEFVTVPDGSHGIGNIAPAEQNRIYREAARFLTTHL